MAADHSSLQYVVLVVALHSLSPGIIISKLLPGNHQNNSAIFHAVHILA